MIQAIALNGNFDLTHNLTTTGKAWIFEFNTPNGARRVFVPVSQSKIERGILWVADWLLQPHRDGIAHMVNNGYTCREGVTLKVEAEAIPEAIVLSEVQPAVIKKGFFTVEAEGEKHRTFRVKTSAKSGKTIIGLMVGSNNLTSYLWFGYVNGSKIQFWGKPNMGWGQESRELPITQGTANACWEAILGNPNEAGLRFANESKQCARCGRVLTNPESIENGIGPECINMGFN